LGTATLLGNFTESITIERVSDLSASGGSAYIGGTTTFTTAKGLQLVTGPAVGQASYYIDPTTGDEHTISTEYLQIISGTGKFAGATGVIIKQINADLVTNAVQAIDYGYISLRRR
jgi:hypothetical protein